MTKLLNDDDDTTAVTTDDDNVEVVPAAIPDTDPVASGDDEFDLYDSGLNDFNFDDGADDNESVE